MEDLVRWFAESMGSFFTDYFVSLQEVVSLASLAPSERSVLVSFPTTTLWNLSSNISTTIGTGVASTIISLFLFFELAAIFNRSDTKGWDGIYWILMAILKVIVAITIAKNMSTIIGMCFQITGTISDNIGTLVNTELNADTSLIAQELTDYYLEQDAGIVFWGWIVGLLINVANNVAMTVVKIICQLRFIEIYIFTAVAPLPFCTFISQEYKNIGISYIKRLLALGLQGVFIIVVCVFYVTIVNASIGEALAGINGHPITTMFSMLGYSILLLIAIFQTSGWSKALLQVN